MRTTPAACGLSCAEDGGDSAHWTPAARMVGRHGSPPRMMDCTVQWMYRLRGDPTRTTAHRTPYRAPSQCALAHRLGRDCGVGCPPRQWVGTRQILICGYAICTKYALMHVHIHLDHHPTLPLSVDTTRSCWTYLHLSCFLYLESSGQPLPNLCSSSALALH